MPSISNEEVEVAAERVGQNVASYYIFDQDCLAVRKMRETTPASEPAQIPHPALKVRLSPKEKSLRGGVLEAGEIDDLLDAKCLKAGSRLGMRKQRLLLEQRLRSSYFASRGCRL